MSGSMTLAPFKELLLRTCGHSFENERAQALSAGLCRRMAERGVDEHAAYLALLLRDGEELHRLTELLTVNETYFFREPEHLKLMVDTLLPAYMAVHKRRPVRILSAGCSYGEEPYSIAILLRERFGSESERLFAITAVDIDSVAIAGARKGVYGNSSFRGMDNVLHERYFRSCGQGKFQVVENIRKLVEFDVLNLLGGSYPQKMQIFDMILYRNVSIYFPVQVQREIFGRLAELLAEGGGLLVGAAETIHHDVGILSLVKQNSLFYYHKTAPLVFEERRATNRNSVSKRTLGRVVPAAPVHAAGSVSQRNREQERQVDERFRKEPHRSSRKPDIKAQFDEAISLAHKMLHAKSLAILDNIIEQDPSFEKAYCLKGSLLLSASRYDEARTVCENILGRDPLCLEACLILGIVARQNSNDDEALRRFREAIYLKSSCWLAHFYTAEILFAQRDLKRARSSFEATLKVLANGELKEHGRAFFPLSFNAEQFVVICRHKLSLLQKKG